MRICERCGQNKELTTFYKDKSRPLGRSYVCILCERIRASVKQKTRVITPEQLARIRIRQRRDYWINRHKHTAKRMVQAMIKAGDLIRQPCVKCGNPKSLAHHPDYAKPLEVVFLCHIHHSEEHTRLRNIIPPQ